MVSLSGSNTGRVIGARGGISLCTMFAICMGSGAAFGSAHGLGPVFGVEHLRFASPPNTGWGWSTVAMDTPSGTVLFLANIGPSGNPRPTAVAAVLSAEDGYQEPILGTAPSFTTSGSVISMLTGDHDGDGHPDLYMWDSTITSDAALKVVPFDGAVFGTPIDLGYSIHQGPGAAASFVDLDGDGRADVVFKRSATQVGVVWSTRPGQPAQLIDLGFTFEIAAVADIDGDGVPDVLLRRTQSAEFHVWPGTGADQFGPTRVINLPSNDPTAGVLDLTGDGQPDIVLGSPTGMTVLVNDHGAFTPVVIPVADGVASIRPVGDFDDDGLPDAIVRTSNFPQFGNEMDWVWRNPMLGYSRADLWLAEGRPGVPIARDMNGDGLRDLVTLAASITVDFRSVGPAGDRLGGTAREVRREPRHVEAADLDSDGIPELIVTGRIAPKLYRRGADGTYAEQDIPGSEAFMSRVADLNGDGLPDLIVSSGFAAVDFNPGLAGGGFGAPARIALPAGTQTHQLVVADLNADGLPDVAVAGGPSQTVYIFHGRHGQPPVLAHSIPIGGHTRGLCVIGTNNESPPALMVGDITNRQVRILTTDGSQWTPGTTWDIGQAPLWLAGDDFDGDGHHDVVLSTVNAPPRIIYGSEAGLNPQATLIQTIFPGSSGFLEHTGVDLTGNGLLDLVAVTSDSSVGAWMYLQVAPRQFVFGGHVPGLPATGLAVADLDADGALDIVTVSDSFNRGVMCMTYGIAAGCQADLNTDGVLNFFDLAAYLALFTSGDPAADLAPPFGVLNFFDLSAYLVLFNAGCP